MTEKEKLERYEQALEFIFTSSQVDGDHHKAWVIDELAQILAGDDYRSKVAEYMDGEDGPGTYSWDIGIAP